ncbi:hypothetical protein SDJN03_15411, partial [Cucurbita argyrosperma subsp. sororia]
MISLLLFRTKALSSTQSLCSKEDILGRRELVPGSQYMVISSVQQCHFPDMAEKLCVCLDTKNLIYISIDSHSLAVLISIYPILCLWRHHFSLYYYIHVGLSANGNAKKRSLSPPFSSLELFLWRDL